MTRDDIVRLLKQRKFRDVAQALVADKSVGPLLGEILVDRNEAGASWIIPSLKEAMFREPRSVAPVLPALIKLLDDNREWARPGAAYIMAGLLDLAPDLLQPAVVELVALLDSRDEQTRLHAASVLEEISKKELQYIEPAIPKLLALLRTSGQEQAWAAYTLGEIGRRDPRVTRKAIPTLIETLDDQDKFACSQAAWALGNMGAVEALEPLERMKADASPTSMFESRAMLVETTVGVVAGNAIQRINACRERLHVLLEGLTVQAPEGLRAHAAAELGISIENRLDQGVRNLTLDLSAAAQDFALSEEMVTTPMLARGDRLAHQITVTPLHGGNIQIQVMLSAGSAGIGSKGFAISVTHEPR